MSVDRQTWYVWARNLHRWKMQEFVASFLEAAGPLNMFLAQVIYLGQPLFAGASREGSLQALASMLEDINETEAFVSYLRETKPNEPA